MVKFRIVILAAGIGKRMKNPNLPKALTPLKGKPMLQYLLDAVAQSGIDRRPAIVIGKSADQVKTAFGDDYDYILQAEQLGTGHAVMAAKSKLIGQSENILVLYSDQPLISSQTIKNITATHLSQNKVITMGTVTVPDFDDWRAGYYDFGRIIRNRAGELTGIIERRDATSATLEGKELNPSYFCFKADWLWPNLDQLENTNGQGEYYLTDLIKLAVSQGQAIATVAIEPKEALGVNSIDQLKLIEQFI